MDPTQPLTDDGQPLLDLKRDQVDAAGIVKRAQQAGISPSAQLMQDFQQDRGRLTWADLADKYGDAYAGQQQNAASRQELLERVGARSRTTGEMVNDTGLSILSGGVNLVGDGLVMVQDGISQLPKLVPLVGQGLGVVSDKWANAQLDGLDRQRAAYLLPQQKLLRQFDDWRSETASSVKQADQQIMGEENAAVSAANLAEEKAAIARGDSELGAGTVRFLKNAWQNASNLTRHSTSAYDMIVEQGPTLGMGVAAKSALLAREIAAGTAKQLAKEGIAAATKEQLAAATEKATEKLVHGNLRAMVTATEMGSNYGQAAGEIATLPWDELVKRFPEAGYEKDKGDSEDVIRERLASKVGLTTAALTAPIAYASSFASQGYLAHPMGKGVATTLKKAGVNVAEQMGEAGEEFLQGAGGQIAQNIASRQAGDTQATDLLAGAGEQAGLGAAAALGTTAATRAPGLALTGSILGAKGAYAVGKAGLGAAFNAVGKLDVVQKRSEAKQAEQTADARAQQAAQAQSVNDAANTLNEHFTAQKEAAAQAQAEAQAAQPEGTTAAPVEPSPAAQAAETITAPAQSDPLLTEADVATLRTADEPADAAPLSKVEALGRALNRLTQDGLTKAQTTNLNLFALKAARELGQHLDSITDPSAKEAAQSLLENEHITKLEQFASQASPEQVKSMLDALPADALPADAEMSPELQQKLGQAVELVTAAPASASSEQIGQLLAHRKALPASDVRQLEAAQQQAVIREAYTKTHTKGTNIVTDEVMNDGFTLGQTRKPSLNQHVQGVMQAVRNGNMPVAVERLGALRDFAQSRVDRAKAFDDTMVAHAQSGSSEDMVVPGSRQLSRNTQLGYKPGWVNSQNGGSHVLVDAIHNDATAVTGAYNSLTKSFPELLQVANQEGKVDMPAEIKAAKAPSYKAFLAGSKGNTPTDGMAAPVEKPGLGKVSSALSAAEDRVAEARNYGSNPPANADVATMQGHVDTLKKIEAKAIQSRDNTDPAVDGDKYQRLDDLRMNAKDARETLEKTLAADAAERASGKAHPDDLLPLTPVAAKKASTPVADRRTEQPAQRVAIDALPAHEAELAKATARVAELEQEQRTSEVTGLPNQKAFTEDEALGWKTVGAADMDGLKKLNDSVGHAAADTVLKALGSFLKGLQSDTVRFYHRSGDEFAARFKDAAEAARVMQAVQAELDKVQVSLVVEGKTYTYNGIGFSVGHGANYEAADAAVNANKAARLDAGQRENPRDAGAPRRLELAPAREAHGSDVRGEQAVPEADHPAGTVADRFPGLHETLGEVTEDMTPAQKADRQNKFLAAFKLNKQSLSLLVRFGADLATKLKDIFAAAKKDPDVVKELYTEKYQYLAPTAEQAAAMGTLLNEKAAAIAEQLNTNLQATANGQQLDGRGAREKNSAGNKSNVKAAGFMARLFESNGKTPVWVFGNRLSLHMARWFQNDKGERTVQYQESVAQAVSLAAVHWVVGMLNMPTKIDEEDLDKLFPEGAPANIREAFATAHYYEQPVTALAAQIESLLGLKRNGDVSQSYTDALPKALALDALAALRSLGMLEVFQEDTGNERNQMQFIRFNKNKDDAASLQKLRDDLGRPSLLTNLLFPDSVDVASVGEPIKGVPQQLSGSRQDMSKQQKKAIQNKQETPHFINMSLVHVLRSLGEDTYAKLLGVDARLFAKDGEDVSAPMNRNYRDAMLGIADGLGQGWSTLWDLEQAAGDHSLASGKPFAETPIFNAARVVGSNARTMDDPSSNQQGSKFLREAVSATKTVLDLTNPKEYARYMTAIGQALGIKTEKHLVSAVVEQAEAKVAEPAFQALMASMKQLLDTDLGEASAAQIANLHTEIAKVLGNPKGVISDRALHALVDYTLAWHADDASKVTSHLAFELDGKTDGPINALKHFGLWAMAGGQSAGLFLLQRFRQGGLLINTPESSLNEVGSKIGDLYENASNSFRDVMKQKLGELVGMAPTAQAGLRAAMYLFKYAGHLKFDSLDLLEQFSVAREPSKATLTPTIYGSGERAVLSTLTNTIVDKVYEAMSQGKELAPQLQKHLHALAEQGKGSLRDLSNPADYANFTFTKAEFDALRDGLKKTIGKELVEAVRAEVAPALDTYNHLYTTSGAQVAVYRHAFKTQRDALRAKQVAEGKLGPNDALSKNDENTILDGIRHLAPVYHLLHTSGKGKQEGINIAETNRSGKHEVNGKEQTVQSITGGFGLPISSLSIKDAGVRIAALLTQALGDATMMTEILQEAGLSALDVFDGLEVSPDKIEKMGLSANQAVLKGWLYDGLGAVNKSQEGLVASLEGLPREELEVIARATGIFDSDIAKLTDDKLREYATQSVSKSVATLTRRAAQTRALTKAIFDGETVRAVIDHMAGAQNAVVLGDHLPILSDEQAVQAIREKAKGYYEQEQQEAADKALREAEAAAKDAAKKAAIAARREAREAARQAKPTPVENPKTITDVLANLGQGEQATTLDATDVSRLVQGKGFKGKIQQFVWKQIEHLLPPNLQVHIGSPDQISRKQHEIFPDVAAGFGDAQNVGETYQNHVFIKNGSEETLLHELVHAATYGIALRFYSGAKGLTTHQRDAMKQIETLTRSFVELPTGFVTPELRQAQSVVNGFLKEGKLAEATNEFLAWTLSNEAIQDTLSQVRVTGKLDSLKALAKTVLTLVRKALGLSNNSSIESFMEQTLGQFHRMTRRPYMDNSALTGQTLAQRLADQLPPGPDSERLQGLLEDVSWMQDNLVRNGEPMDTKLKSLLKGRAEAMSSVNDMLMAGFELSDAQEHVAEQVHALLSSGMPLDSFATEGMEHLRSEVMAKLTAADLQGDPDTAQARLDFLQGKTANPQMQLANFVSLALVDPDLRSAMEAMSAKREKGEKYTGSFDDRLREFSTRAFDGVHDWFVGTHKAPNQQAMLDALVQKLRQNQEAMVKRQDATEPAFDQLEGKLKNAIEKVGDKLSASADTTTNKWGARAANTVAALTSDERAAAAHNAIVQMTNSMTVQWKPLAQLIKEVMGVTESERPLVEKLNQVKSAVARVRQRLRETVPSQVRGLFQEKLTKEQWTHLQKGAARTGMADLLEVHGVDGLGKLVASQSERAKAMQALESQLGKRQQAYRAAAKATAAYMTTRTSPTAGLLYMNARAMAQLAGQNLKISPEEVERVTPLLDQLISLRALDSLSEAERGTLGHLLATDKQGMQSLLTLLQTLSEREQAKDGADGQLLNAEKGYLPESFDPRHKLVLASPERAMELAKQGYVKVGDYVGDSADRGAKHMAYYAVRYIGGQASFRQGALQIVSGSVSGVDALSGMHEGVALQTLISNPTTVARITAEKLGKQGAGQGGLIPIFNTDGSIRAYQRTLDPAMIETHLRTKEDLPKAIGNWMGRQTEEHLATEMNGAVAGLVARQWNNEKGKRAGEYIDISKPRTPVEKDAWNAIPPATKKQLQDAFGGKDAPIMVRKDMLDNTMGYRAASVADVFTGMSELPDPVRKAVKDTAYALLGKKAYARLLFAERAIQGGVGTAKDIIVVKSGVVALANSLANSLQLVAMGVPPWQMAKGQVAKIREAETYLRREQRLAQLTLKMATIDKASSEYATLDREAQAIHSANQRLSIWPLIEAGEMPAVAEGMAESDDYSFHGDMLGWIEKHTQDLPKGVLTVAKYALISQDTALYQGLNRAVQLGDFVAKAVLYDHLLSKGKTHEEAMSQTSDSFVNYNLLAGRSRDYLESMGVTWFWNYKLRIQRVILRNMREHPLRFLLAGGAGAYANVDSLMHSNALNTNWLRSFGPRQGIRAHNMLLWDQLFN